MFPGPLQISHYMMSLEYLLFYKYFACMFSFPRKNLPSFTIQLFWECLKFKIRLLERKNVPKSEMVTHAYNPVVHRKTLSQKKKKSRPGDDSQW